MAIFSDWVNEGTGHTYLLKHVEDGQTGSAVVVQSEMYSSDAS